MQYYRIPYFADAYGQGTYGCGTYDNDAAASCATGTGTGTGAGAGGAGTGSLVDTGMMLVVLATVACLIIFASLLVRFWRRPSGKPAHDSGVRGDHPAEK